MLNKSVFFRIILLILILSIVNFSVYAIEPGNSSRIDGFCKETNDCLNENHYCDYSKDGLINDKCCPEYYKYNFFKDECEPKFEGYDFLENISYEDILDNINKEINIEIDNLDGTLDMSEEIQEQMQRQINKLMYKLNNDNLLKKYGDDESRTCNSEYDCENYQTCINNQCKKYNLQIILYPSDTYKPEELEGLKDGLIDFFTKNIGMENCKQKFLVKIEDPCPGVENDVCSDENKEAVLNCFEDRITNYDKIPTAFVGIGTKFHGNAGRVCGLNKFPTIIFSMKNQVVISHEMGHSYGLLDEYCYNPPNNEKCPINRYCDVNPTDPKFDGDESVLGWIGAVADWVDYHITSWVFGTQEETTYQYCLNRFGYGGEVYGNKWDYPEEGRAIMSYSNAPGPRGWDYYEKVHLNSHGLLQCD